VLSSVVGDFQPSGDGPVKIPPFHSTCNEELTLGDDPGRSPRGRAERGRAVAAVGLRGAACGPPGRSGSANRAGGAAHSGRFGACDFWARTGGSECEKRDGGSRPGDTVAGCKGAWTATRARRAGRGFGAAARQDGTPLIRSKLAPWAEEVRKRRKHDYFGVRFTPALNRPGA